MIMGLVHSIVIERLEPIVGSDELINSSQGFLRSESHLFPIEKIPISLVGPNLFLSPLRILRLSYLSHSK